MSIIGVASVCGSLFLCLDCASLPAYSRRAASGQAEAGNIKISKQFFKQIYYGTNKIYEIVRGKNIGDCFSGPHEHVWQKTFANLPCLFCRSRCLGGKSSYSISYSILGCGCRPVGSAAKSGLSLCTDDVKISYNNEMTPKKIYTANTTKIQTQNLG